MQALPAQPESLCIVEMGGVEKQDELGEKGAIGFLYLNIGLQVMSLLYHYIQHRFCLLIKLKNICFFCVCVCVTFSFCDAMICIECLTVCVYQNGVLLRTVLDPVTGDLSDTRTRYLGSRPVKLFRVRMQGQEAVSGHAYPGVVTDSCLYVIFVIFVILTFSGVGHVQPIMAELLVPVTFPSDATFL